MMRDRNAMEICIFGMFAVSVSKSALFIAPLPPSLQAVPVLGHLVAILLFIGCIGSLIGLALNDLDQSLITEQFFLAITGLGFFGYAAALLWAASLADPPTYTASAYVVGLCLGIGAFTIWRFVQVQRYVKRRKLLAEGAVRRSSQ